MPTYYDHASGANETAIDFAIQHRLYWGKTGLVPAWAGTFVMVRPEFIVMAAAAAAVIGLFSSAQANSHPSNSTQVHG